MPAGPLKPRRDQQGGRVLDAGSVVPRDVPPRHKHAEIQDQVVVHVNDDGVQLRSHREHEVRELVWAQRVHG